MPVWPAPSSTLSARCRWTTWPSSRGMNIDAGTTAPSARTKAGFPNEGSLPFLRPPPGASARRQLNLFFRRRVGSGPPACKVPFARAESPAHAGNFYIFSLRMHIFSLKMYILNLRIHILRLKMNFLCGQAGFPSRLFRVSVPCVLKDFPACMWQNSSLVRAIFIPLPQIEGRQ